MRGERQQYPNGQAQRARQMCYRRIHGYYQIEPGHQRGGVCEITTFTVRTPIHIFPPRQDLFVTGTEILL